jgi:hypothetical protein
MNNELWSIPTASARNVRGPSSEIRFQIGNKEIKAAVEMPITHVVETHLGRLVLREERVKRSNPPPLRRRSGVNAHHSTCGPGIVCNSANIIRALHGLKNHPLG